jgi:hypothetical protein
MASRCLCGAARSTGPGLALRAIRARSSRRELCVDRDVAAHARSPGNTPWGFGDGGAEPGRLLSRARTSAAMSWGLAWFVGRWELVEQAEHALQACQDAAARRAQRRVAFESGASSRLCFAALTRDTSVDRARNRRRATVGSRRIGLSSFISGQTWPAFRSHGCLATT